MRAWIGTSVVVAFIAICGAGGYLGLARPDRSADAATSEPTAVATTRDLSRTVTATGVVRPVTGAEIKVGAEVAGTLKRVPVKVGDRVSKGDPLASVDPSLFRAKVDQAEATLRQADAELDYARLDHERKARLRRDEVSSAQSLDAARLALASAEAKRQAAAATARQAQLDLDHTQVTAPIDGVVAEVSMREGETLAMRLETPTLVTIVDLDRLEVRAYVDETDIGRVQLGQKGIFSVDTYPDREIPATVTAIEPKPRVENGVVNYIAVLTFAAPSGLVIRPEMTAHVKLTIGEAGASLTIPRSALRRDGEREFARVRRGETWTDQTVVTGRRDETTVEIREGLAAGDIVRLNAF